MTVEHKLGNPHEGYYLPPIFTIGKFIEEDRKGLMPLSIQVHHAVLRCVSRK